MLEAKRRDETLTTTPQSTASSPRRCALCNDVGGVQPLEFHQLYAQAASQPAELSWSACRQCCGWFADPMPSLEQIASNWRTVDYAAEDKKDRIFTAKVPLFDRVLRGLAQRVVPGALLDIGCNFGSFLSLARSQGWTPAGIDPNPDAAQACVEAGFDVRYGWDVRECGFADGQFAAITAIDVFCYSLQPFNDLVAYRQLLQPGGMLAMRLTTKHAAMKAVNRLTRSSRRDEAMSRLLLGQFHSANPPTIRRWLAKAGFADVSIQGGAMTCPWSEADWKSRLAYGGAELVRALTLGTVSLSPGVLVFARRPK